MKWWYDRHHARMGMNAVVEMPDGQTGTVVGVNQEARTADVEVIDPDGRIEIVTTQVKTLALASQREEPAD